MLARESNKTFKASSFSTIRTINRKLGHVILGLDGVTAVGVGYYDPATPSRGAAIIVYTRDKRGGVDPTLVREVNRHIPNIPRRLVGAAPAASCSGKPVGVANAVASSEEYDRWVRPVRPGYSIGGQLWLGATPLPGDEPSVSLGTAGLTVVGESSPNQRYILSCAHVLDGNLEVVDPPDSQEVYQPGGVYNPNNKIGTLHRSTGLRLGTIGMWLPNQLDAAICKPSPGVIYDFEYGAEALKTTVKGVCREVWLGMALKKSSRTTGDIGFDNEVWGVVDAINVRCSLGNEELPLCYEELIVLRSSLMDAYIALDGDSGSVWLDRFTDKAALMTIGGSGELCFCSLVEPVLRLFGVTVPQTPSPLIEHDSPNAINRAISTRVLSNAELARVPVRQWGK